MQINLLTTKHPAPSGADLPGSSLSTSFNTRWHFAVSLPWRNDRSFVRQTNLRNSKFPTTIFLNILNVFLFIWWPRNILVLLLNYHSIIEIQMYCSILSLLFIKSNFIIHSLQKNFSTTISNNCWVIFYDLIEFFFRIEVKSNIIVESIYSQKNKMTKILKCSISITFVDLLWENALLFFLSCSLINV